MRKLQRITSRLALPVICAAVLFGATLPNAFSQTAKVKAGTLTCKGKGRVGLILGSKETLDCVYAPSGNRPRGKLIGTITNVGLDIGVKGKSTMIWAVLGSTTALPAEALRGTFVGAAADASLGLGAGAKVLVGGNNKSVVLQPLSVQGQTGVNLAVGVTGFKLEPQ
jgi:Protein of unknown function (DUF992)